MPSTSTWIGGAFTNICLNQHSGDGEAWSNPLNWLGGVPGAGDTAVFPDRFQVTTCNGNPVFAPFDATATVDHAFAVAAVTTGASWNGNVNVANGLAIANGLTLASGSFGGSGAVALAGASQWTAGTLNVGTGGLTNTGILTIANPSLVDLRAGGTLSNSGTIAQSGAGSLRISDGTTLTNSGTYNFQANADVIDGFGAGGIFNNPGTILKNTTTGASTIGTVLNSSNAITVQSGTLALHSAGGTNTGGTFSVGNNAVLDLTDGTTVTFQGTYTGSGAGTLSLNSGTLAIGAANASFNFPNGLFQWTGGTLEIDSGRTLTNVSSSFLTLSGASSVVDDLRFGGTLVNNGRIVHKNAADLRISDGTVLNNQNNAVYEFQTDVNVLNGFGAGGTINNAGTILKSGGTGVSTIGANLNSSNAITVQTGTVALHSAGGTNTGGTFTVGPNAVLDLTNGTSVTYQGTYTASGTGTVSLNSGTLVVGPANATFNFPAGMFQWTGGTLEIDTGHTLTNASTGFLNLSGSSSSIDELRFGGTLINNGRIIHRNGADLRISDGTVLNNQAGAMYELQTDVSVDNGFGAGGTFNNAGTILKSATTGASPSIMGAQLNNSATIDVEAGTLQLRTGGGVNTGGSFIVGSASAVLDLTGGTSVSYTGTYTGSGPGTVQLNNGNLNVVSIVGSTGATFNFPAGLFQWTGGNLNTTPVAPLTNGDTMTLSGSVVEELRSGGTLTNNGTIIQRGAGILRISDGTTLVNDGTYNFQADSNIVNGFGAGGTLLNPGTILKTNTTGTSVIGANLVNSATIDVETGTLVLNTAGGTNTGGNIIVAANAVLDLTGGGSVSYVGSYTGSGAGTVVLAGGNLVIGAANADFNFPTGMFRWSAGTLQTNGNTLTIDSGSGLTLNGPTGNVEELRGGGMLVNNGTITQVDVAPLRISDGTVLNNNGTYNFQADANILNGFGAGGVFNNPGTILKTNTTGTSVIGANLNNSATIDVESGTIALATAGGLNTGGNFIVASGAVLDLTGGGSVTYVGSYTGMGGGTMLLSSGNLIIGAASADFNLPAGMFVWSNGTLQTNGNIVTIDAGGSLTLAGSVVEELRGGGMLINFGTITQTGAGEIRISDASQILNQPGALYDIQVDSDIANGFGAGGTFLNNGTFQKSAGTGTSTVGVPFTNADTPGTPNSDAVLALSGTLNFANSYTQTAGDTNLGGGTLMASFGLNIQGGVLDGSGDVFANVTNGGTVSPGGDGNIGVLTIHGTYTQTASGALNIDIQDAMPGDFDQLIVTGAAALAGTLNVNVIGTVNSGDSFVFLTFASSTGDFAALPPGFAELLDVTDRTLVAQ